MRTRILALLAFGFFLCTAFRAGWNRPTSDFPNYYTAAAVVRKGEPLRSYYDWTWFQRQMNYAGVERQLGSYAAQTPLTMLPVLELTTFAPQTAKRIWLSINLVFLAGVVWLLSQVTRFRVEQIALLTFCGFGALYTNFLLGQYYVFLLFLLTLAFYLLHRQDLRAGGFLCGTAFALKLYGGPFLLYFAAKRNWKALAGMILACTCFGALAIAIFGWRDLAYYATQVLPRSLEGNSIDPYHPGSPTLSTLLRRAFVMEPELNAHPLWNAPWLFFFLRPAIMLMIVAFTVLGLATARTTSDHRDFSWFMVAVLLLSSSVGSYTFILLLLPVALLLEDAKPLESIFLITCFVLLTLPLRPIWMFPKVWLMLLVFIVLGRDYWRATRRAWLVLTAVLIVLISLADARRHMVSFKNEPGQRFGRILETSAISSTSPAVSRFGLFYQAMTVRGYGLHWLHEGRTEELSFEGHALHPVAPHPDGPVYFELVANGKSTTMQFDPSSRKVTGAPMPPGTIGTTDPAISPDRKWVAFTSMLTGSQQVWLRNTATGEAQLLAGGNCNSSSPSWELNSQALVFASDCGRAFGMFALYRAPVAVQK